MAKSSTGLQHMVKWAPGGVMETKWKGVWLALHFQVRTDPSQLFLPFGSSSLQKNVIWF